MKKRVLAVLAAFTLLFSAEAFTGKPVMAEAAGVQPLSVGNHTHYSSNSSSGNSMNISPGGVLGVIAVIVAAIVFKNKN